VLYRHGDKILLTLYQELVGFDDLVGFFGEYARHHHLIFATRDDFGEWTQAADVVSRPSNHD
jgi:ATP:corrinoid adenosyltransferase